jgi:hypothetical protein
MAEMESGHLLPTQSGSGETMASSKLATNELFYLRYEIWEGCE